MAGNNHAGDGFDGFPVDVVNAAEGITAETITGFPQDWEGFGPPKSLAIVGSHPATRQLAPYEDDSFDIWLFNESPMKPEIYRRWDAAFQMHLPEVYRSQENWVNKEHWPWLQKYHGDKIIWMQEKDPDVPNSRKYPLQAVLDMLGPDWRYLRSTPAMALALAILLGYKHIQLYGSELTSNTEYGYQAINMGFWIGFALGRGVNLEMRCWEAEFNQPIYGYEGEIQIPPEFYAQRIEDLETPARLNKEGFERVYDKVKDALHGHNHDKVPGLFDNLQSLAQKAGEAAGALSEARRYAERTNQVSRQEFERVAAQAQLDLDEAKHQAFHYEGVVSYVWNVYRRTGTYEARRQLLDFLQKQVDAMTEAGRLAGVMRENLQYQARYDDLVTAAGGQRAVSQAENLINRRRDAVPS